MNNAFSVAVGFVLGFVASWLFHSVYLAPAKVEDPVVEAPVVEVVPAEKPPAELMSVPLPPQELVEPAPAEKPKASE